MAENFVGPRDFSTQGPLSHKDNPANFYACIHMCKVFAHMYPYVQKPCTYGYNMVPNYFKSLMAAILNTGSHLEF